MSKLGQMWTAVAKKQTYNAPMRVLSHKEVVTASFTQRKKVKASNHKYRQILTAVEKGTLLILKEGKIENHLMLMINQTRM